VSRRSRCLIALVLVSRTLHAQANVPHPSTTSRPDAVLGERVYVQLQSHLGVATVPFPVPALSSAKGQAVVVLTDVKYVWSETFHVDVRLPVVLGSVAQPAGSYRDAAAVGNPELAVSQTWWQTGLGGSTATFLGGIAVGMPLASHDPELISNRLLAIGDGLEGRGHPEWFTPGVSSLTPSFRALAKQAHWTLELSLALPLLWRVSSASLNAGWTRDMGVAANLELELVLQLSDAVSIAGRAQLFAEAAAPVRYTRSVSPMQDFEQLHIDFDLAPSATLFAVLQTAAAGSLGGAMLGGGLGATVTF
jgi:hypothetical protein